MHKLFFDISENASEITVTGEDFSHLTVLRIKKGDTITVSDGISVCYTAKAESFSKKGAVFSLYDPRPFETESKVKITAYCALLKSGKSDSVIQKAVELGASEIVLFQSKNCVAEASSEKGERKLERWNKISRQAAMQSGRDIIPSVRGVISFKEMISELKDKDISMFLHEKAEFSAYELLKKNPDASTVGFAVGPEGGFTDLEVDEAVSNGIPAISLGKRILRAETAPLCILSICGALFE